MKNQQDKQSNINAETLNQIIGELFILEGILAPANRREQKRLRLILSEATLENPIKIYVGSCPDYSHNNRLYTHEGLGEDVPLLSTLHLQNDMALLDVLDRYVIPYEYIVMLADIEAEDEIFAERFTDGNTREFRHRCSHSVEATQALINQAIQPHHKGKIRASSFFMEFGYDECIAYQEAYIRLLTERFTSDSSFHIRVENDTLARFEMYRKMYPPRREGYADFDNRMEFLFGRTMRTMAQYLSLGRFISIATSHGIIITHPTVNISMYNAGNRFVLPGTESYSQPAIPIFQMKRRVYE